MWGNRSSLSAILLSFGWIISHCFVDDLPILNAPWISHPSFVEIILLVQIVEWREFNFYPQDDKASLSPNPRTGLIYSIPSIVISMPRLCIFFRRQNRTASIVAVALIPCLHLQTLRLSTIITPLSPPPLTLQLPPKRLPTPSPPRNPRSPV